MASSPYTIKEASEALGVSDKTIRRWLDRKELEEHSRDDQGRILITAESIAATQARHGHMPRHESNPDVQALVPAIEAFGDIGTALAQALRDRDDRLIALAEQIGRLELLLEQEREEKEHLRRQLEEAHTQNTQQQAVASMDTAQTDDQISNQRQRGILLRKILHSLGIG